MGQYYILCNINKCQHLDPHKWGSGLKLLEWAYDTQGPLLGLAVLLADGNGRGGGDLQTEKPVVGSWAGDRIIVAGDYADAGLFLPDKWFNLPIIARSRLEKKHKDATTAGDVFKAGDPPNLYNLARLCFADVSELAIDAIRDDGYSKFSPTDYNFIKSTVWANDTVGKEELDLSFLTPNNLRRVLYEASERGQQYFEPYVKWLQSKKLPTETADIVGRVEWLEREGFTEKYHIRENNQ